MKKERWSLLESVYEVFKFLFLALLIAVLSFLLFYGVKVDTKGYDIVFFSRIHPANYYGVNNRGKFELWKTTKKKHGGIYIIRLYPRTR